jgi:hypothetical protein
VGIPDRLDDNYLGAAHHYHHDLHQSWTRHHSPPLGAAVDHHNVSYHHHYHPDTLLATFTAFIPATKHVSLDKPERAQWLDSDSKADHSAGSSECPTCTSASASASYR